MLCARTFSAAIHDSVSCDIMGSKAICQSYDTLHRALTVLDAVTSNRVRSVQWFYE